ncbi:MAG: adenosylcobalamin-dependent ribonucleoside-diphosphate reductase [Planctomycetaceae bacterium]|nr:adenosylcobalamin-dependent ribonucleoside-diphosphate reductase [Planctomycetaceae bacterium]
MAERNHRERAVGGSNGGEFSSNALRVLSERYFARDADGQITENVDELFHRVARNVAGVEEQWSVSREEIDDLERAFHDQMIGRRFLPNSPTLMNAGRSLGMLSACFVLPLEDSIPDIMDTARQIAFVQRAGGGTGVDLSRLRPNGSIVRSSGGTTAGPLAFLQMFSGVTDAIQQGAFRRGANMGVLRVDHPDILAFIDLKSDLTKINNYNLSVAVTDTFMAAVRDTPHTAHAVVNPHTGRTGWLRRDRGVTEYEPESQPDIAVHWTIGEVWSRIVRRGWEAGDPGLLFIDEVNRHNPVPKLGPIRATNPCGEQPLLSYEACNLGSINLSAFVHADTANRGRELLDWDRLEETVALSVRFLDDVVEANRYPTPEIHEATHRTRKIGLGVMGFADLLYEVGIAYDSERALEAAERIGGFIQRAGWSASERLAAVRGVFPVWEGSVWNGDRDGRPMRNAQVTCIAPTGTISILARCSSGIEPVFSLVFDRHVLGGQKLIEVNPVFERVLREHFGDEEKVHRILEHAGQHGSIQDLEEVPREIKAVFRTARDVSPEWHVRMQAAWQRHTDAAVSKTINLPTSATIAEVEAAYLLAHELNCKGITVYRDGSRPLQPMALATGASEEEPKTSPLRPVRLPEVIPSVRLRQVTPFGNMHVHISVEPGTGREREVFAQLGKGGDLANADLEAVSRLVSLLLRSNGDLRMVIDQLEGIGSSLSIAAQGGRVRSLGDGLARVLSRYLRVKETHGLEALLSGRVTCLDTTEPSETRPPEVAQERLFKIKCPECDGAGTLAFEEGCLKCHACGFSQC